MKQSCRWFSILYKPLRLFRAGSIQDEGSTRSALYKIGPNSKPITTLRHLRTKAFWCIGTETPMHLAYRY